MITAASAAATQIFTRPFRAVLVKTLALTLLLLTLCGFGLGKAIFAYVALPHAAWLATLIHVVASLGLLAVAVLLITPVSFAVASCFFDELADHVESDLSGDRGQPMPMAQAGWVALRFIGLSLAVNLLALLLLFVPGLNLVAFFGANAYLLGLGFFELAALRYCSIAETKVLARRHAARILLAGCLCAALAAIPIVNLLTPLFATALLVRVAHPLVRRGRAYPAV